MRKMALAVLLILISAPLLKAQEKVNLRKYLKETKLLDFSSIELYRLSSALDVRTKTEKAKILKAYRFIRDTIRFGFNEDDNLPASKVLMEGRGYSNTKATLLMAALRNEGIPCRIHFFKITKKLYKGLLPSALYSLLPDEMYHSWVEVYVDGEWKAMEGVVVDIKYLRAVQKKVGKCGPFIGYGIAVDDLCNPPIRWNLQDTYIQHKAIIKDLGIYNSPDEFYAKYGTTFSGMKGVVYRNVIMKALNKRIEELRKTVVDEFAREREED